MQDLPPQPPAPSTADQARAYPPPVRRMGRRGAIIGTVIAVLAVVGLGWLAWSLTHPDADAQSAQGAAGRTGAGGGAGGAGAGGGAGARPGGGPGGGPGGRAPATTVGIAVAEKADIPVIIDALGTVVPQATVRVRPQVSGVLQSIDFKEGQMLKKGQLMARIDSRPFDIALQQALGARQRNEATLQAARVTLQRYQTLLTQDSIARQDVDTQAATVKQLEAQIMSDRANEAAARLNLTYTRIEAPINGRVGLRSVDVGNVISASDANGVATIAQLTPIDVEFAIAQDQAAWLQHNAGASMEVKAWDRTRSTLLDLGAFGSLDNLVDPQTGTVKAKARFNNARMQLFPSQFVNVSLQIRTITDAVVVPVAALRQGANGEYVFVLAEDRTVKQRPVVRGQVLADRIQVATGLKAGERVITEGADRLRDGSRVVLPGDAGGGPGGQGGGMRRQRGAASGAEPAASAPPFTGASAAKAPAVGPGPTPPWAGASAMADAPAANRNTGSNVGATAGNAGNAGNTRSAGNPGGGGAAPGAARGADLSPEERAEMRKRLESMTPEEREARRKRLEAMTPEERAAARDRLRQQRGQGGGGSQ